MEKINLSVPLKITQMQHSVLDQHLFPTRQVGAMTTATTAKARAAATATTHVSFLFFCHGLLLIYLKCLYIAHKIA